METERANSLENSGGNLYTRDTKIQSQQNNHNRKKNVLSIIGGGLILLTIISLIFIYLYKFTINKPISKVYAAQRIKTELNKLEDPDNIVHTITQLAIISKNSTEKITYDLWEDNSSDRFKNVVDYPKFRVIQLNDGLTRWDIDTEERTLKITHLINVPQKGKNSSKRVLLLSEFKEILNHKQDFSITRGTYNDKPVIVISFEDKNVNGPDNKKQNLFYKYYFDNTFKLIAKKIWQRTSNKEKTLKEEIEVKKYETLPRTSQTLQKIFTFDKSKFVDFKITEVYKDVQTGEIVERQKEPTITPTYIITQPTQESNERVVSALITPKCKVEIITNKKREILLQTSFLSMCYQFANTAVSLSGQYVAFEDISEGTDSVIRIYSLQNNDTQYLVNLGTPEIFDLLFLPNDILVVLSGTRGDYNTQYITTFDIPSLLKNYPRNIDKETNYFTNTGDYEKSIHLPNRGCNYDYLKYSDDRLQVFGSLGPSAKVLQEYYLQDLKP